MKAIESISYCSLLSPWQDVSARRLAFGLIFSLLAHTVFAWWITQPATPMHEAQSKSFQRLEISLVGSQPAAIKPKSAQKNLLDPKPLAEASTPMLSEESPSWEARPVASEETYFAPEDVEAMAHVVEVEDLPLPENKQTPGGALYLKVLINESGGADKVDILTSTLPDEYATLLVGSFYQAKFSPALLAGIPVKSWRIIEIRFDLPGPTSS